MATYFTKACPIVGFFVFSCVNLSAYANESNVQNLVSTSTLQNNHLSNNEQPTSVASALTTNLQTHQILPQADDGNWFDERHQDSKKFLGRTAHFIDDWFGKPNPNEPAKAQIRVMTDIRHNTYDGTTIKPRIRAKVKLPTLERKLSVIIGDDTLDYEQGGGIYNDERLAPNSKHTFDSTQSRKDNSSLALRWSKFKEDIGVSTDIDLGLRSDDLFARWRGEKRWQNAHDISGRFEQVYRYGTKSEHYALSTLEFNQPQSKHRTLINRSHIAYTHQDNDETLGWSNSFYQQHHWQGKHGVREFSYGVYTGGDIDDKKMTLNTYGPYVSYRMPIWREWLFIQTDLSYYNDKAQNRDHHLASFGRLEIVF